MRNPFKQRQDNELVKELRSLREELERQRQLAESVDDLSLREAHRSLADIISSQLGTQVARRF